MVPPKEDEYTDNPRLTKAFKRLEKKLTIEILFLWVIRLLKDGPKYAYELKQEFQDRFGFSPATVTNYTVLYLLEKEGIVKRTEVVVDDERIDRKYYALTELGEKLFDECKIFLENTFSVLFSDLKS
ncbi:MAG: PadR family transcriptional regulator [Candidatus Heimdallarchaeum aukensis]|uniref:PadR family transcriptional regulator n=1 Tax=Candidatus Heimdallarchaeum aukensis TaxID=2876573 RepID=A0A9Y1BJZ4_9ARCH|nr:MAG: PadR family transcriptional regulator [Candidatus Heimdallarchaeum aukensis]